MPVLETVVLLVSSSGVLAGVLLMRTEQRSRAGVD